MKCDLCKRPIKGINMVVYTDNYGKEIFVGPNCNKTIKQYHRIIENMDV